MTDRLEIIIIELPKAKRIYKRDKKNKIGQWMMFLDNPNEEEVVQIMGENENIRKAIDELEQVSGDEKLRRIAELREKAIRDEEAAIEYAKEHGYEEGKKKGKREGLEEGRKEGEREGLRKGIGEGIKQNRIETARKLLKKNIKPEEIAEITELSIEEIKQLNIF